MAVSIHKKKTRKIHSSLAKHFTDMITQPFTQFRGIFGKKHGRVRKTFCIKIDIWTFSNETLNEMLSSWQFAAE